MTMTVRCGVKVFVVVVAWTRGTLGDARLCFAGNARVGRRGSAQSCFTILGAGRVQGNKGVRRTNFRRSQRKA